MKVKGFNPQVGDWLWLSTAPDGKVQASGKVDACIQCHIKAKMDLHQDPEIGLHR